MKHVLRTLFGILKMEEYKIPSDYELDGLAEDYVCSLNDEDLPVLEEELTEECLREFLNDRGYEFVEEQRDNFINYILYSSDASYERMREDAKQNFRDSLEEVIESADDILSNEDKLKIIISVTNYNFGD